MQGEAPWWPNAFIEAGVPPETFIGRLVANPMHAAPGDCVQELLHFCLAEIEPIVLN